MSSATTPLISRTDRSVPITVLARAGASPSRAFRVIAPIDLSTVFDAVAPFPGVARVLDQDGSWDQAGRSRTPQFDDGSQATERLSEYVQDQGFAYELTDFTNALRGLVAGVRGEWSFLPDGSGTSIRWTYEFKPLPGRRWILAGPFAPLWRRYMRAALARMVAVVDA
ncbi:SRPBCC family protein [Oerskovia sp. KBS0722]|uniref:SRPBCC family protein n=1 Tax=Oerskovia sp. KBS0722 TaxID=1179673 RepID=UPI00110F03A0|nr:SRPBCC family protein [Oerskovia sp. KBS0722]QDW64195.1 SRPBCC family protein [Oerskovia sp. KBS0722]